MSKETFSSVLTRLVNKKMVTKMAIAHHVGISRTYLYEMMRGEKIPGSWEMIDKISTYFQYDIAKLTRLIGEAHLQRFLNKKKENNK